MHICCICFAGCAGRFWEGLELSPLSLQRSSPSFPLPRISLDLETNCKMHLNYITIIFYKAIYHILTSTLASHPLPSWAKWSWEHRTWLPEAWGISAPIGNSCCKMGWGRGWSGRSCPQSLLGCWRLSTSSSSSSELCQKLLLLAEIWEVKKKSWTSFCNLIWTLVALGKLSISLSFYGWTIINNSLDHIGLVLRRAGLMKQGLRKRPKVRQN